MTRWYDAIPGVTGTTSLSDATLSNWPDKAMETRLHDLDFCPIMLSELYIVARHLPMTVIESPAGPELVADLRPDRARRAAFDADGKYVLPYRPVALRMLPFFVETDGNILRMTDLSGELGPARPLELQKRLCSFLGGQVSGRLRMRTSLQYLMDSMILLPATKNGDARVGELQIDIPTLSAKHQICTDFLGLRIINSILFAVQNLKSGLVQSYAGPRARLSLVRDDAIRQRPFLTDASTIDFDKLFDL